MGFWKKLFNSNSKEEAANTVSLPDVIAMAWENLDAELLAPYLAQDFLYNSVWVSNTMKGKDEYLRYLKGKFETIRKSGAIPKVKVDCINGVLMPTLYQKGVGGNAVIDFDEKDGKITKMLMRPHVQIAKVLDEQWESYAKAYQDFLPRAFQISGQSIQEYVDARGFKFPDFSWIKTDLMAYPSFQHMCFRYGTQIYAVLIAIHGFEREDGQEDNNIVVSEREYDNLISESEKHNLIPCILPVAARPQLPMLRNSHLIHALTEELIAFVSPCSKERVPMSKWEINNMGICQVVEYLEKKGYKIHSYCDIMEIYPQVWFEKDGKTSYVIVRSIPIGQKNDAFVIYKAQLQRLSEYDGYFADVQFASSSADLRDDKGNLVPLSKRDGVGDNWMWRGDGFYCNFTGLQEIE